MLTSVSCPCRRYKEAIGYHKKALSLQPKSASTFSAIGYNYMLMLDFSKAVEYFHKALSLRKNDSFTNELLTVAVDELVNDPVDSLRGGSKYLKSWSFIENSFLFATFYIIIYFLIYLTIINIHYIILCSMI